MIDRIAPTRRPTGRAGGYQRWRSLLFLHWPVPVEVVPFAWRVQQRFLEALGATVVLRGSAQGDPFVTDQGNLILDCRFGPIERLDDLADRLAARAGIVEHGLFLGLATDVIVAGAAGIEHLTRN